MKFRQIWSQRLLDRLQLAGIYKQQFCAKLDQLIVEGVYLVFSIQMECPNGSTLTIGLPRVVVSVPNIVMFNVIEIEGLLFPGFGPMYTLHGKLVFQVFPIK